MIERRNELIRFLRHGANSLAALLVLIGFVPGLVAQQYCVSGAITSVLGCNGCIFNVGDPVAMTLTVQPSSVTCLASSSLGCAAVTANAAFSANIGARYWTGNSTTFTMSLTSTIGGSMATDIEIRAAATLSPLPSPPPSDELLAVILSIDPVPGNLITSGMLPAALPSPDAVTASNALHAFQANGDSATPYLSYTGQVCAAPVSAPVPPAVNSIVNDASFTAGGTISTGSWVAIFGSGLAPAGDSRTWNAATEIVSGKLPVSLDGTSVTVNGKPAAVEFIQPSQVNIQTPDDTAVGPVQVVVTTAAGASNSFTANYATFAPGLFPATSPYIVAQHADNSYVTAASPAKPGEVIILWGTGFGPASPAVPAGQVFSGANPLANTVTVTIGGQSAAVDFAGVVGAGLVQINVHVPPSVSNGDAGVVAMVGGVSTQTTANMISIHN